MTTIYPRTVYDVREIMTDLTGAGLTPRFHASSLCITVPCELQDIPPSVAFSNRVQVIDHA